jgi:hypothetical protein
MYRQTVFLYSKAAYASKIVHFLCLPARKSAAATGLALPSWGKSLKELSKS